ncbi:serine hydrolase domain-containing protein [Actinosynnema sp. NPDC047251]|uniref:Beta-lactamase, class C n=1 Tax=Saccharothrix espanaensis (strain ATCC 51144 / DSM 44229 / JCM 9112 / NBRC 15066 / NRRL 15764) TaxID=1179773 RepID=K0JXV4_SACES|nr:serine hydrolase domain-containing protein [Saccharothrix espanaensis]CCH30971.1 beta-lactamase, class C [Saccharothrix espanaensis DSM 44229]
MAEVHGTCDPQFAPVRDAFAATLDTADVGASLAVFRDGRPVLDLWGGHVDEARTTPWERDTIVNVWSTTKTMAALCVLVLADRGALDLDGPVAAHWPEFAAHGKDAVLVRHVLAHTAGLPTWDRPITVEDLYDHPKAAALLADQPTRWPAGEVGCYHSLTQGYLLGELVHRVTGRSLGAFFAEDVAGPLGADFHIGLAAHDRVAPIIPAERGPRPTPTALFDAPPNPEIDPAVANTEAWRRAEVPSANGHGNARSVAAVQSVLACGGTMNGVRLLSPETCARVLEEQYAGMDHQLGVPMRYGLGYALSGDTCSWGGWGGSLVVVDPGNRLTVAYAMNRMLERGPLGDDRGMNLVLAAYGSLG